MNYTRNLIPAPLPAWLDFDGRSWDTHYLSDGQLAAQGWLPLIYDPEGAPLGYADPVAETRDGRQVTVAYALGTEEERETATRNATNSATWAAQAKARKDREAKAALALPDSDDPVILRRKLNAALHLIQR
jgi:hypothetical protein